MRNAFDFVWAMLAEKAATAGETIAVAGLKEGVPHEVATRFKKGGLAAGAYSSGDASTWPAASRSSGTVVLPAVTALGMTRVGNKITLTFTGGMTGAWITAKYEKNINGAGWSTISDAAATTNSADYDLVGTEQSGVADFRVTLRTSWVTGATFTSAGVALGFTVPISVGWTRSCHSNSPDPGQTPMYHITVQLGDVTASTRLEIREGTSSPYVLWAVMAPGVTNPADYLASSFSGSQTIQMRARHESGGNISDWRYSASQMIGSCP